LRIATVSRYQGSPATGPTSTDRTEEFHAFIRATYSRLFAELRVSYPGSLATLFEWPGSEEALDPVLFMAHYDVVPAERPEQWSVEPFGGIVREGYIYGRGALDDKGSLCALLEACDALLREGERPRRTILIALGGDEEVGGNEGAAAVARHLAGKGHRLAAVFDEGGAIGYGLTQFTAAPFAYVGVAEKAQVDVRVTSHAEGGHSSQPSMHNPIHDLSRVLRHLTATSAPARVDGPMFTCLRAFAGGAPWWMRPILRFPRLTSRLVCAVLADSPEANATLRTTYAPTLISAGQAVNIVPGTAEAVVNIRVHPRETSETAIRRVRAAAAKHGRHVTVEQLHSFPEPVSMSPARGPYWAAMNRAVHDVFPGVVTVPYLMAGTTDSRHFAALTSRIYRFAPLQATSEELKRIHGIDERISIGNYLRAIAFFKNLIATTAGQEAP
jgi:carboxypeptidase PM20D1